MYDENNNTEHYSENKNVRGNKKHTNNIKINKNESKNKSVNNKILQIIMRIFILAIKIILYTNNASYNKNTIKNSSLSNHYNHYKI